MIVLFTTVYPEKKAERFEEYCECLRRNVQNTGIDQICILVEGEVVGIPESEKIRKRAVAKRPLYSEYFNWIGELCGPEDVAIVANTDIWFDSSIWPAATRLAKNQCWALSRWDVDESGRLRLFDRNDSQDAWVFRGPLERVRGDFALGVPRCDNRILFELLEAGYRVANPAFSVRAMHIHSGVRGEYGTENLPHFVPPPYRYLYPHNLMSWYRILWHNLRNPSRKLGWKFDRRWAAHLLPVRVVRRLLRLFGVARNEHRA